MYSPDFRKKTILITCSSNNHLANGISKNIGIPLTECKIDTFANTETKVTIGESVRKKHVYIIQTGEGNANKSVNDHTMETLITIDACKRANAKSINVILALYPYSRQDKKDRSRAPITSSLLANLLTTAGATRIMSVELHAEQIQGMFQIPVDNIYIDNYATPFILEHYSKIPNFNKKDLVIVSPDAGGAKRAEKLANILSCPLAIMHKNRDYTTKNKVTNTTLIGDVTDKYALIVDDMADTCGTLKSATDTLYKCNAKSVSAFICHGIFSNPAKERLLECGLNVITTNTLDQTDRLSNATVIDISPLISQAIQRLAHGQSLSDLFNSVKLNPI